MRKLKLEELNRLSLSEFKSSPKINVRILLDNVRSMHNVGSALRTSDAFRIDKVFLCGITATPPHRDIRKTALGAEDSVSWEHCTDPMKVVREHIILGYEVLSVEQADQSTLLQDYQVLSEKKYLLIFGNEVHGVSDDLIAQSSACLEIPQYGSKHSLNISVSIGICLWEFSKALQPKP